MTDAPPQRTALVVGVANKRSIAWAIAAELASAGVKVALTFQNERVERAAFAVLSETGQRRERNGDREKDVFH